MRFAGLGRAAAVAGGVVLVGLAAHGAVWWWATAEIERQLQASMAAPAVPGWKLGATAMRRAGWPLAASVEVSSLVAVSPGSALDSVRWQAERLTVSLELARPRTLVLSVDGAQSVQVGAAAAVPVRAAVMRAEAKLEPGGPVRAATLEVAELEAQLPGGRFALARLDLQAEARPAAQQGETAAALTATARRIALPPVVAWPLGPMIETLGWDLAVGGPVPPAAEPAERAQAWRDGGGVVTLRTLDLAWGGVTVAGGATLALDAQLQVMGAATARVTGYEAALRALTASGVLTPRNAVAAGAVLALMTRPGPQGGPAVVEVPFSVQDRTLSLGRIPLLRLPELVWRPPS